ncbi:MAG: sugar phosphate isomerase/epimerase [Thermomicrobium sp.]|nr:sugar phosphate isomerase/epimerase [Thermomicrobium sp.]
MHILVSTGSLPWLGLEDRFRLIAEAGADGVELLLDRRLLRRDPRELAAQAQRLGVPIRSVHAVLHLTRESTSQEVRDSARFARALPDCEVLVVHPPRRLERVREWYLALQEGRTTGDRRLALAAETLGQHSRADRPVPFDSLDHFLRFTEEWDLGIVFDVAHAASLGWDLAGALRRCRPRLVNVHVSDALDRNFRLVLANALIRDHRLPGTGRLPLAELLQMLRRSGYGGNVTLELSPLLLFAPRKRSVRERLARAVATVRSYAEDRSSRSRTSRRGTTPDTH